jgi:Tfp pilus assembly protein PilW
MFRIRRMRSWPRGEAGVTLVELAITMAGLALVSTGMISFLVGSNRVDQLQAADDAAQEAVRDARGRLARDVREARRFTAAAVASFTVWLDDEWDGVMPAEELVTWSIDAAGGLVRSVGESSGRVEAAGVSVADSRFTYDSTLAAQVTRAYVHLVIQVAGPESGYRTLDFEISLRNVP